MIVFYLVSRRNWNVFDYYLYFLSKAMYESVANTELVRSILQKNNTVTMHICWICQRTFFPFSLHVQFLDWISREFHSGVTNMTFSLSTFRGMMLVLHCLMCSNSNFLLWFGVERFWNHEFFLTLWMHGTGLWTSKRLGINFVRSPVIYLLLPKLGDC